MLIACMYPYVATCGYAWDIRVAMRGIHAWISVAHNKLHEMCRFHATRKCGPRKHITEFIIHSSRCSWSHGAMHVYSCITEWYCSSVTNHYRRQWNSRLLILNHIMMLDFLRFSILLKTVHWDKASAVHSSHLQLWNIYSPEQIIRG